MAKKFDVVIRGINLRVNLAVLAGAVGAYVLLSIYLFRPHLNEFDPWRGLFIPATNIAAVGAFVLALRWIANWEGAFFAGLLYGFGPFTLGFALYHPAASLAVAALPWLFMPAAFWPKRSSWSWILRAVLAIIPFVLIGLFFWTAHKQSFYPVPVGERLHIWPWQVLVSPLIANAEHFPILNFYHVAAGPLIFGLGLFFRIHRWGLMVLLAAGAILGISSAVGPASPIIWGAVVALCGCVIIGLGLNGLALASASDGLWLAICALILGAIASLCGIVAPSLGIWYAQAALWYFLGALAVSGMLVFALYNKPMHGLRFLTLGVLMAADILINSRITIDKLF